MDIDVELDVLLVDMEVLELVDDVLMEVEVLVDDVLILVEVLVEEVLVDMDVLVLDDVELVEVVKLAPGAEKLICANPVDICPVLTLS